MLGFHSAQDRCLVPDEVFTVIQFVEVQTAGYGLVMLVSGIPENSVRTCRKSGVNESGDQLS